MLMALVLAAGLFSGMRVTASTNEHPTPQGHYVFRSYGINDGLLNTTILQLLQDKHGFIWAGTDDGLYRYDGYRFDNFGIDQGLPSAVIQALHEDRQGVLWVGTRSGLSRWNGTDFVPVPNAVATGNDVRAITDNAEGLWLASTNGLYVAGPELSFRLAPEWGGGEATALLLERNTTGLWAAQWDGQAHILRRDKDAWLSYAFANGSSEERIDAFAEDDQGRIWARSAKQLWALNAAQRAFERVDTPVALVSTERGYLASGRRGDLWASSNDFVLHREGKRWTDVLAGAVIGARPVLEDREGSVWFGVRGLQRLAGRGVFHAYDHVEGLPGNVAWSIARDREQTLWVGTESGLARAVGERFETIPGTEAQTIRSIATAPDGMLYLAGIPADVVLSYDPTRQQLRRHSLGLATAPGRIYHVLLDRHGTLWATTDTAGLFKADSRDTQLRFSHEALPDGTPEELLRGLHEDGAGRLWVAGQRGLAVREGGRWRRLTTADGLRYNEVSYVRTTHNDDVLVVYNGSRGFDRARYEQGTLRVLHHVNSASTSHADEIFIIGEDANDNVWVGTGRGIELHTPARTERFTAVHGLVGEDTASMAFLAEPNGDVWFGVVGGLMRFDAAAHRALPPRAAAPADLLDVRLGERPLSPTAHDIQVPHTTNSFQARFASLSFIGDGTVQYKTLLDGLETAGNVTESREARYSALSPGTYRFEVAARSVPLGTWGTPATFAFQVLPAWWQTWWARVLFGLGIALGMLLAVRWRVAALKQHNRLLEERVAMRTAELSRSNALLRTEIDDRIKAQRQLVEAEKMALLGRLVAGVAHEINTPLGIGFTAASHLREETQRLRAHLAAGEVPRSDIDAFERSASECTELLMRNLGRAGDLVRTFRQVAVDESDNLSRPTELGQELHDLLAMLAATLRTTPHRVVVDCPQPIDVDAPAGALNRIVTILVMGALQHAFRPDQSGTITLSARRDGDCVVLVCRDDGIGMEDTVRAHIFEPFFTTRRAQGAVGLGLHIAYNLVTQALHGSINCDTAPGAGSSFEIRWRP
jgi:signal transduction histidine kinase/ligand-binding sensor domain-containing protein